MGAKGGKEATPLGKSGGAGGLVGLARRESALLVEVVADGYLQGVVNFGVGNTII